MKPYTAADWWRIVFALQAYHHALSDSLRDRHKRDPHDPGLPLLRAGLRDTDSQLTTLQAELKAGRLPCV